MPRDSNEKLAFAKDRGEKELDDITDYEAVVRSRIYTVLATWADILCAVTAFSCYN
jgi:hypothetical protein